MTKAKVRVLTTTQGQLGQYAQPLVPQAAHMLEQLAQAAGLTSQHELSLVLCDNRFIRQINRRWREQDRSTDVLSFPIHELKPGQLPPPGAVGDIVVSLPTTRLAARERGVELGEHLAWLLVHGLLHLMGYDHPTPRTLGRMRREEERLLTEAGL